MTQYYKNKIENGIKVIKIIDRISEDANLLDKYTYNTLYTTLDEKDAGIKEMSPRIDEEIRVLNEIKDMVEDFQKEVDKTKINLNRKRLSYKTLDQSARKVVNIHITKEQFDDLPEDIKAIVDPSRISAYEGKGMKRETKKRKTPGKRKGNKKSQRK
jgi:hypothetical protein